MKWRRASRRDGSTRSLGEAISGSESEDRPPTIEVRQLAKRFVRADKVTVPAIDHVSFRVEPGEFVVLLGPSGCGKTTLMRCIAGLEVPDSGEIRINGVLNFSSAQKVNVPPERRRLGMVFQSYALWPHMTAFKNVAYPLQCRRVPRQEIAPRVMRALEMVGIPELAKQHPGAMSGGQQQRVALARALVANEQLVLFDEPLSNVDAKVREQLRVELLTLQREIGFSALFVTHDQVEAMEMAHRIAVMGSGTIEQIGTPREIYDGPSSRYVASFIGTTNEVKGVVASVAEDGTARVCTDLGELVASGAAAATVGDRVTVVCRPERCQLGPLRPGAPNQVAASIVAALFVGTHTEFVVDAAGLGMRVWTAADDTYIEGQVVGLTMPAPYVRVIEVQPADALQPVGGEEQTPSEVGRS